MGVGDDEDDGEDEGCVVEGDSIRGVKANRTKHRGHRCAVCSPDCRQAAAQTALSAQRAYHTAGGPVGLPGPLHPPGRAAQPAEEGETANKPLL